MLEQLFSRLSGALNGSPEIAVSGAFAWGVLSIMLSPCHLASIPLIIGFIDEQGRISTKRAFFLSLLFSAGIFLTITIVGMITGLTGRMLGDIGPYGSYFVSAVFFIVGLHLLGVIPLPFAGNFGQPAYKSKGLLAAFILGLIFGTALGPCTFAYMAPILGMAFSVAATRLVYALLLVAAYAIGHVSVIILAGTFTEVVQRYLNWSEDSRGVTIVKKICGILVIIGGLYLIWSVRRG